MSLAAAALRLITVKALDNATSAAAVCDSVVDPRDLLGDEARPAIAVFADAGARRFKGKSLSEAEHYVDLTIEMFVAKATKIVGQDGADEYEIEYPATDAGLENRLCRLQWEIESILFGSPAAWPDLWRRAINTISAEGSMWERGADSKAGARFNFRRIAYRIDVISDPARGEDIDPAGFWHAFLVAAEADQELDELAKDWRALISTPSLPAWRLAAAEFGLPEAAIRMLSVVPYSDDEPTDRANAAEDQDRDIIVTVDAEGATTQQGENGTPTPIEETNG
jgi:hypothetical protein